MPDGQRITFRIENAAVFLALFGAMAVLFGYLFEIGFAFGLDDRLLEFFGVSDYITAASSYIFVVPVVCIALGAQTFFPMTEMSGGVLRNLGAIYVIDGAVDSDARKFLERLQVWAFGIAFAAIGLVFVGFLLHGYFFSDPNWQVKSFGAVQGMFFVAAAVVVIPRVNFK